MTAHGLWLLPGDEQRLMSFDDFPWFRDAPIGKVTHVAKHHSGVSTDPIWISASKPSGTRSAFRWRQDGEIEL